MPESPDANPVPQPSPRVVAGVRKENPGGSKSTGGRNQDPPVRLGRDGKPTTVFVGGTSRPVVNSVAYAIAEMIDLTPFWLDVRDAAQSPDGLDPATTGWIPPDRMFVSEGGRGLEPEALVAGASLWKLVRADESPALLSQLKEFLQLPEVIQEILSAASPKSGPKAVVTANSDRLVHMFPKTPEGLQRFLTSIAGASLSIVAAHTGAPVQARFGFKTVFRVDVETPARWMEGTIVCEQGIAQGPFALGRSNRLSDVPGIARVFAGLHHLTS